MRPFAAAVLFLAAGLATADVVFTEKAKVTTAKVLRQDDSRSTTTNSASVKGRLLRLAQVDDPGAKPVRVFLFDGEKSLQRDLNPRKDTYGEMKPEEFTARAEAAKKRVADYEPKVEALNGDKRIRLERWIWNTKRVLGMLPEAPKVEVKRGEKKKIGEWDCEQVTILEADAAGKMTVVFDFWMTEQIDGWGAYLDFYTAYRAFSPAVLEKMKELKGFHVQGTIVPFYFDGDGLFETNEIDNSDARKADVPAADFEVPASYKLNTKK
ncbi:MAG: hypothetical protein IT452_16960 [Planctomycetia bacterium]|nr:hypothetical protein [Planctomycetia bacterium]